MAGVGVLATIMALIAMTSAASLKDTSFEKALFDKTDEKIVARYVRQASPTMTLVDAMFLEGDANHDDHLDATEFWGSFDSFDGNGDKIITLKEYVEFFTSGHLDGTSDLRHVDRIAARIFHAGDMNHDDVLSHEDAAIIFSNLDQNHDNLVSNDEYHARWGRVLALIAG